ncbi:hypothetical protein ACP4OV_029718 [Aristida adscensionis]
MLPFYLIIVASCGLAVISSGTAAHAGASPSMVSSEMARQRRHHFVLVHGFGHGAWCWFKVATALEAAGHRVTVLDMAACGASAVRAEDVPSLEEYSRPLLDAVAALPDGERAVLVGHSFGGISLALAMERHPEKVAAAVFVTAAMPPVGKPMTFVFQQNSQRRDPMDNTIRTIGDPKNPDQIVLFGPKYMARTMYQLSPAEDLTLARAMVRPSRRFWNDTTFNGDGVLTAGRYGAVRRVFVVVEDDASSLTPEFQRRMVSWSPGTEVRGLRGADHMAMFSKPTELSELLIEIAGK